MKPDAHNETPPVPTPAPPGGSAAAAWPFRWLARQKVYLDYQLLDFAALLSRGVNSLKVRGLGPTMRIARKRLFPARRQPYALLLYSDIGQIPEVRFPATQPRASVIVPVHNQLEFTLRCLASLAASGDATPYEVIVVDDASSDATADCLPGIPGLHYHRSEVNGGFIASCNAGARRARGEFLVFLNNDTVVQPGWLDHLLGTFEQHPDTGLAGSKLVYPDGRLQEAGGIIYADGKTANYGRNEDPSDPRFNFVREADYCSGAALAIRRRHFEQIGGFDALYLPAYFEDTELAMRVRQLGLKVRFQPASVVVHFEGASSGTDVRRGVKQHQLLNQEKFTKRWAATLAATQPRYDPIDLTGLGATFAATHRQARRILVVDSYTPTPDRDSGSVRMIELMKLLIEEGCSVVFFCQSLSHEGEYSQALQQLGVETWWHPWIRTVPGWLDRHGERFDAVIGSRHYVLAPLLPLLRALAPSAELVFDTVDLHFLREQREAEQSGDPAARATSLATMKSELGLVQAADITWVVSQFERAMLSKLAPDARIEVVSNIHRISSQAPGFEERSGVVFVGSFRHPPNVDAALWLVHEIWPLVLRELPDAVLHLVGADAPVAVLALGSAPGVRFHGHVPDLDALLDASRVSVAPLRYGAGIKGKINQSMARGLPVVGTACATEGMFLEHDADVLVAGTAAEFAEAVVRLHRDQALWQRLREGGLDNTRRHFSRDAARAVIRPWLAGLPVRRPA